jgi:NAD(P)-dependent dehydrogenase (short-subunit alcohol dehydrogenase family)
MSEQDAGVPDIPALFGLHGRTVAVVGAGSGIGEAVAHACAGLGASVACLDIDEDAAGRVAKALAAEGASGAEAGRIDICDADGVRRTLSGLADRHGRLDGVVCTPGINVRKPILGYAPEELQRVVTMNLGGTFNVLQTAGRIMRDAGRGSIVLFASIRAVVVEPGQSVYAATKAGIVQLARTAAAELSPHGVRVNALAPGVVETPLTKPIKAQPEWYDAYARHNALGRWAQPHEMAGPTAFLLTDAASYVTGSVMFVDGGWTAIDGRFQPPGMA